MSRTAEEIRRLRSEVEAVGDWWHPLDLGDDVVTPGRKGRSPAYLEEELRRLRLPEVRGRTVLDIGASDGFYSFEAERLGAARVVAVETAAWDREPCGFDVARRALGSSVEKRHQDFTTCDLDELGRFDVVLFLGVLYHLEEPLAALRRLRSVTDGVAVIESEAVRLRSGGRRPLAEFFPDAELNDDPTNWWSFTLAALVSMTRAAGFERVDVVQGPPRRPALRSGARRYRAVLHAFAHPPPAAGHA